jgi:hypothetical protein
VLHKEVVRRKLNQMRHKACASIWTSILSIAAGMERRYDVTTAK